MTILKWGAVLCLIFLFSFAPGQPAPGTIPVNELRFLGEYDLPFKKQFAGTTVGGLSGIDYDSKHDQYYLISDDRSSINPARFYTAKIYFTGKGIDSVSLSKAITLLQADGTSYPNSKQNPEFTPDPEAIRYNGKTDQLVWSSEGERLLLPSGKYILQNPSLTLSSPSGKFIAPVAVPAITAVQTEGKGTRQNGGFEGMTFTPDFAYLFYNVEVPLYNDGEVATLEKTNPWIRIFQYDPVSKKDIAQYAYSLDPVAYPSEPEKAFKINGVPDMLSLGEGRFLVMERSFSLGRPACTVKVFLTDLRDATDISKIPSLQTSPPEHPAQKKLLLNMDTLGIYIDNVEGMTFGPDLPNGHKTLIFVSDDNFQEKEKTQFLLFEVVR